MVQMLAAISGCHQTASAVNLLDTGKREDVYSEIASFMSALLGTVTSRKMVKKPLMTYFYGSTAVPERIFGEGTEALGAFYQTLMERMPGAYKLMTLFQSCWNPEATHYKWTMPDGHRVVIPVIQTEVKKIEVDELDHITFNYTASVVSAKEEGRSLAANITHSIDAWVLREMVRRSNRAGFELATIHDCFFAHPNYMNQVRQFYREILAELSQLDLVNSILRDIGITDANFQQTSSDLHKEILKSEYALS